MELLWGHVYREKSYGTVIVIAPVAAENPALGVHLCVERGVRKGSKDQRKGGLQAVLDGEFGDLVEDRRGIFIKSDNECTHDTNFAFLKATDAIGIFRCSVRELMHGINRCLRERLEADVHADTA